MTVSQSLQLWLKTIQLHLSTSHADICHMSGTQKRIPSGTRQQLFGGSMPPCKSRPASSFPARLEPPAQPRPVPRSLRLRTWLRIPRNPLAFIYISGVSDVVSPQHRRPEDLSDKFAEHHGANTPRLQVYRLHDTVPKTAI